MKYVKEFKEALSFLPDKEKDKLILRLLKKDWLLTERLMFELVDVRTLEERREEVKKRVISDAKKSADRFYSARYLKMDIGYISGFITEHVKITKDKFGEAHLNLVMINKVLLVNKENLSDVPYLEESRKFYVSVIARAFKILILISKLHEDTWLDFEDDLNKFGQLIGENDNLMKSAIHHSLDVNWLLNFEIPEDIVEIHKELRQNGFLK